MEATTIEECEKFRGSKYVQSKIGETYKKAKQYLDEGRIVLFSGTQCQIKGLNLFLRKKYDNLISVDIVCHGVPSPFIFKNYKDNLKKKYKSEIKNIRFRDKNKGWKRYSYTTEFKNGEKYSKLSSRDIYMVGFLKDLYLRPSCYSCEAKNFNNNSDITLADYWGIQDKHPDFDDDKGVSLVLVNSDKGQYVFNKINNYIDIINTDLEYSISHNPSIITPTKYNEKRDMFFKDLNNNNNLEDVIEKYTKISLHRRIINRVIYELKKIKKRVLK